MASTSTKLNHLNLKPPDPPNVWAKNFSSVVANKDTKEPDLKTPSSFKGEPIVLFTLEDIKALVVTFKYSIVGKFSHGRPSMDEIRKIFLTFNLKQPCTVGLIDNKHVLIKLECEEDFVRLWTKEQWYLSRYPMQNFRPDHECPVVPAWIYLPNLPIYIFTKAYFFSSAQLIRKPLKIDASTVNQSQLSMARFYVKINLTKDMPKRVWISIRDGDLWLDVIYENLFKYCSYCLKKGHEEGTCMFLNGGKYIKPNRLTKPYKNPSSNLNPKKLPKKKLNLLKLFLLLTKTPMNLSKTIKKQLKFLSKNDKIPFKNLFPLHT